MRVHAAGVDQGVWHLMTGMPYARRLAGFGVRAPKNPLLGYDVAGRVEAVGALVTEFRPGQELFGTCRGSFAEYAVARPDRLLPKPDNVSFEQAASVPTSGFTALQAVRHSGVRPGQRVLIIGAGGGVGTFAVQIAKAVGAEVTGVSSASKTELVRSIGADHVIDYTRQDFADGRNRYDVILDIAGNRPLSELRRALTPRGTLMIVGGEERATGSASAVSYARPHFRRSSGKSSASSSRRSVERTWRNFGNCSKLARSGPLSTGRSRSKRCLPRSATSETAAHAARSSSPSDPALGQRSGMSLDR